jgi:hypothetical protein
MGYVINPPSDVSREALMRGIALGLQKQVNFIPPLKAVVESVLQKTEGHKAHLISKRFTPFDENPLKIATPHESTVESMLNLLDNYDWCYGKQHYMEEELKEMQLGDTLPIYCELFLDKDTGGPQLIFGKMVYQNHCPVAG